MVKLKGQLLSLDAGGALAKTLIYSNWKGRPYAKKFTLPRDPNTPAQIGLRQAMTFLSSQWPSLSAAQKKTWDELAGNLKITLLDAYNSINLTRFVEDKGLSKEYPPAEAANTISIVSQQPTASERFVTLGASTSPPTAAWGYVFYQDASMGFTPAPANVVGVIVGPGVFTVHSIRVTPPFAGTWYSRYASFNDSGTVKLIALERSVVWPPP